MPKAALPILEQLRRKAVRAYRDYLVIQAEAKKETDADREALAIENHKRQGRPAKSLQEIEEQKLIVARRALDALNEQEKEDGKKRLTSENVCITKAKTLVVKKATERAGRPRATLFETYMRQQEKLHETNLQRIALGKLPTQKSIDKITVLEKLCEQESQKMPLREFLRQGIISAKAQMKSDQRMIKFYNKKRESGEIDAEKASIEVALLQQATRANQESLEKRIREFEEEFGKGKSEKETAIGFGAIARKKERTNINNMLDDVARDLREYRDKIDLIEDQHK
ncbi:hypothetical protein AB6D11_27975 [Vibrio splendidus]